MRFLKNIFSQLHSFVLWAMASILLWGWIFSMVTDAPVAQKITVYCDVPGLQDTALAVALEEEMPEGIRMIKVHSFDYVMLDVESMDKGDVFIIPASNLSEYGQMLTPLYGERGVPVYDAETGDAVAAGYIEYGGEDYYLFLGAGSAHLEDGKAAAVARRLLSLK